MNVHSVCLYCADIYSRVARVYTYCIHVIQCDAFVNEFSQWTWCICARRDSRSGRLNESSVFPVCMSIEEFIRVRVCVNTWKCPMKIRLGNLIKRKISYCWINFSAILCWLSILSLCRRCIFVDFFIHDHFVRLWTKWEEQQLKLRLSLHLNFPSTKTARGSRWNFGHETKY